MSTEGDKPVVLYVETTASLKKRLAVVAKKHFRSLAGEARAALEEYLQRHEAASDAAKPEDEPKKKKGGK
jgi:plasmid stability protein